MDCVYIGVSVWLCVRAYVCVWLCVCPWECVDVDCVACVWACVVCENIYMCGCVGVMSLSVGVGV